MELKNMNEKEPKTLYSVIEIEQPMGYGKGKISYENYISSEVFDPEVEERFFEIIRDFEAFIEVQESDDGCIDGRWTVELYVNTDGEFELVIADNSNHERPKVAGGGYVTGLAMRLGAIGRGSSIDEDLVTTAEAFAENDIYCGAHSAGHTHVDENGVEVGTGCGANDEFPVILHNGVAYKDDIKKSMGDLLGAVDMEFDKDLFDEVIANWEAVLADESYFAGSTGALRLQKILNLQAEKSIEAGGRKPVAVTKKLEGAHKEIAIVVNFADKMTLSQGVLAQKLAEKVSERQGVPIDEVDRAILPQSFVVDAWRVVQLASTYADEKESAQALYAGVIYQLATAATLTDGSLKMAVYKPE